jgi:hypothetical protein
VGGRQAHVPEGQGPWAPLIEPTCGGKFGDMGGPPSVRGKRDASRMPHPSLLEKGFDAIPSRPFNSATLNRALASMQARLDTRQGTAVLRRFRVFEATMTGGDRHTAPLGLKVVAWFLVLALRPSSLDTYARALAAGLAREGTALHQWHLVLEHVRQRAEEDPRGLQPLVVSEAMSDTDVRTLDEQFRNDPSRRFLVRILDTFGAHGTDVVRLRAESIRVGRDNDGCWLGVLWGKTKTNLTCKRPPTLMVVKDPPGWALQFARSQVMRPPFQLIWDVTDIKKISEAVRRLEGRKDLRSFRRRVASRVLVASGLEAAQTDLLHSSTLTTRRYLGAWEERLAVVMPTV